MAANRIIDNLQDRLAQITDSWWWLALRGILIVLFGLYGLLASVQQFVLIIRVLAIFSLLDAISVSFIALRRHTEKTQWFYIGGRALLGVVVVALAFSSPSNPQAVLPLLIVAVLLVGILDIVVAFRFDIGSGGKRRAILVGAALHLAFAALLLLISSTLTADPLSVVNLLSLVRAVNGVIIVVGVVIVFFGMRQRARDAKTPTPTQ